MKPDPAAVLSGIFKGGVLGPMLFVMSINHMPEVVKCDTYISADDTKIPKQKNQRGHPPAAIRLKFIGRISEMDTYVSPNKVPGIFMILLDFNVIIFSP